LRGRVGTGASARAPDPVTGHGAGGGLPSAWPQRAMRAQAAPMKASSASGPKDMRTAFAQRSSGSPIASNTWLGAAWIAAGSTGEVAFASR
jgi:hypothetical protein